MTVRRVVPRVLAVCGALLLLFYAVGGWYFSGQISSTGLRVKPASISQNLLVVRVGSGSITLHEQHGRVGSLHNDEVYGLKWSNGFGQVSGAPVGSGSDVTRSFTLLTGTVPAVSMTAGLSRDAFPDDPAVALGRPVQQVTYGSPLGAMPAWYVGGKSTTWAVLVHGWTSSRTEMLRMMRATVQRGLPSLDISYRNDLGVAPDPSHRYQYGRTEWRDLDAAVRYARDHGATRVVLLGASMGGAIVASFLQHSAQAALVTAVVLDAPMLSFGRAVDLAASRRTVPGIGITVPRSLTWTAKQIAAIRYDINWGAVDYLRTTGWDRVPTLIFHGDADTRVPISGSRVLAARLPALVELHVVSAAGHVESWNCGTRRYDQLLAAFLARWS